MRVRKEQGLDSPCKGLTHAERFLLEVLGQMRTAGDAVDVALQHVPTHLVIEGITKLIWDLQKREGDLLRPPSPQGCTEITQYCCLKPERSPSERQETYVHV